MQMVTCFSKPGRFKSTPSRVDGIESSQRLQCILAPKRGRIAQVRKMKNEPSLLFSAKIEMREDAIADLPTPGLPLIYNLLDAVR
jgi:hypothetical protein